MKKEPRDFLCFERQAAAEGFSPVCGVDEAGRGPLAGDVYSGAVILPPDFDTDGLDDSKKLTALQRERMLARIQEKAVWACGVATVAEIEEMNILRAALLAMRRAADALPVRPALALVDGNQAPDLAMPVRTLVKGDSRSASIAAASIVAKVLRDRYMDTLAQAYPEYRFEQHKGYPTPMHYKMLLQYGPSPVHRRSFLKKFYEAHPEARPESAQSAEPGEDGVSSGKFGEDAAAARLEACGYRILARNYRAFSEGRMVGEADLVAMDGAALVFVEVKQRRDRRFSSGLDAVTPDKLQKLRKAAEIYLQEHALDAPVRIDVAEVYTGLPRESAFGPTYAPPEIRLTQNVL